jgi:hypothetical protein
VTILYTTCALLLHFVLGAHPSAGAVLVHALAPTVVLNLLITAPVYALCRRVLRPAERPDLREVRLLG